MIPGLSDGFAVLCRSRKLSLGVGMIRGSSWESPRGRVVVAT